MSDRKGGPATAPDIAERQGGTKQRILEAALETLKAEGYAGTSAREIARRGGFNQALIFYHFGTLNRLLLAALDLTSEQRMARYSAAVAGAQTFDDMLAVAARIYREDLEAGHMTVVSELMAGSMAHPELKAEIIARMEPWIDFAEGAIRKVLAGSPFEQALPARHLAFGLVAFYCGINMLSNLSEDRAETEELFAAGRQLAPFLAAILQVPQDQG
jgi:AcrR family transcriptional regulator